MTGQMGLRKIIREALLSRTPERIPDEALLYKHAGVLIPLLREGGVHKVLLTKRTDVVEHHKGQISFPGGAVDEQDDSIMDTALREAHEEIGLEKDHVEILGRIDDTITIVSNFVIHPFVGFIPSPYEFTINTAEVQRLIKVPLSVFPSQGALTKTHTVEFEGMIFETQAYEYNGDVIWGATARMMENFIDILGGRLGLLESTKSSNI